MGADFSVDEAKYKVASGSQSLPQTAVNPVRQLNRGGVCDLSDLPSPHGRLSHAPNP